ncbi:MAG: cob(I)yrinic acid a,c-diamide adenosyltransferase [Patescibacteria group bacterium]|nr:cob(I)yrinic acid a,c-diamide adenosyltransferase [Patescibacteria group bacterium]
MIAVFTGEGKGKTSAALGTAIRMLGYGKKVSLIQVLKTRNSNEVKLFDKLIKQKVAPFWQKLTVASFGKRKFIDPKRIRNEDKKLILDVLDLIENTIMDKPSLIILDEILVALLFGMIEEKEVIMIMKKCKQEGIHLILTGRGATPQIIELADLVTDMQNVKHPYDLGISALKGIDY